jgi:hypothetical protein
LYTRFTWKRGSFTFYITLVASWLDTCLSSVRREETLYHYICMMKMMRIPLSSLRKARRWAERLSNGDDCAVGGCQEESISVNRCCLRPSFHYIRIHCTVNSKREYPDSWLLKRKSPKWPCINEAGAPSSIKGVPIRFYVYYRITELNFFLPGLPIVDSLDVMTSWVAVITSPFCSSDIEVFVECAQRANFTYEMRACRQSAPHESQNACKAVTSCNHLLSSSSCQHYWKR